MSFQTALTGLNAATADLDVISNNIANSGTTGFKQSRALFADIYAITQAGSSSNAIGQGVRVADIQQQFSQGTLSFSGNALDLAIKGNGFFRLSDDGVASYSRAGAFEMDRDGYIVSTDGRRLTGYGVNNNGEVTDVLSELQVDMSNQEPQATGEIALGANLDSGVTALTGGAIDPTDAGTFHHSTSVNVYDELGNAHLVSIYFRKEADNEWEVTAFDSDGNSLGSDTLQFHATGDDAGTLVDDTPLALNLGGGQPIELAYDTLTQYGDDFGVSRLTQDGYATGRFADLSVAEDGTILARYSNGQSRTLGQVALSYFPNPEGLQQLGDTSWAESHASGEPITGRPGSTNLGLLNAGALEQSNVNLTEELVDMITAQRNFQANSQMISTEDQVTQTIMNIR